jgi:hypothetical protein
MEDLQLTEREQACAFIDDVRIDNGGITREDEEFLKRERPHLLRVIYSQRKKLGAATKTCVNFLNYLTLN